MNRRCAECGRVVESQSTEYPFRCACCRSGCPDRFESSPAQFTREDCERLTRRFSGEKARQPLERAG